MLLILLRRICEFCFGSSSVCAVLSAVYPLFLCDFAERGEPVVCRFRPVNDASGIRSSANLSARYAHQKVAAQHSGVGKSHHLTQQPAVTSSRPSTSSAHGEDSRQVQQRSSKQTGTQIDSVEWEESLGESSSLLHDISPRTSCPTPLNAPVSPAKLSTASPSDVVPEVVRSAMRHALDGKFSCSL